MTLTTSSWSQDQTQSRVGIKLQDKPYFEYTFAADSAHTTLHWHLNIRGSTKHCLGTLRSRWTFSHGI